MPKNKQTEVKINVTKVILTVLMDIALVGIGLLIFAYFHHVKVDSKPMEVIELSTPAPTPTPTPAPTMTAAPIITPEPTDYGMWGEKFDGKFLLGDEVISTENSYQSHDVNITVEMVEDYYNDIKITYYVADVYIRNIDNIQTGFAEEEYRSGTTDTVLNMDITNSAILAMTGDYFGIRSKGVVIRNGQLFRDNPWQDVLVMYYDGSMETFYKEDFDIDAVIEKGAYQAWSFGPMLLDQGQTMTDFNSTVAYRNPRASIGYYEPGHYSFILVDGRQDGYSRGMELSLLSEVYYELGCTVAYNLDGGQSSVMTFNDEITNIPYKGGRKVSDIVFITEIGDDE